MKTIQSRSPDFFLGATTPAGFKGYFEPLRREPGMQMLLIKSGPGCGKSTLMKHLAQAAEQQGQRIEKIHCASDPDSLDGVIFLDQKRAIIDATAPHVVEPDAPGADELVVSLYHTIDAGKLAPHRDEVKALFARNAALRGRAARYIASAGSLMLDSRRAEACSANFEKVRRYVKRLCTRLLPRTEEMGSEELRLLSAITPKGEVFYQGTVQALADKCILFRDDYGAVSRLLLELIRAEALCRMGAEYEDEARSTLLELGSRRDTEYAKRIESLTGSTQTFATTGVVKTLLDEIILQRRIELWGEAGRIFDILRLAKGWTRYWEVNGEKSNHTNYLSKYSEYLNFPADYLECIMMIPQAEIDNNPNITAADQNPYVQS